MKKLALTSLLLIAFLFSFSQEQVEVNFCGYTDTISITKFEDCFELSSNNSDWTVLSFDITLADGKTSITLHGQNAGLSETMRVTIKEQKPEKIYIEKIKIVNSSTGETAITEGFIIYLTY